MTEGNERRQGSRSQRAERLPVVQGFGVQAQRELESESSLLRPWFTGERSEPVSKECSEYNDRKTTVGRFTRLTETRATRLDRFADNPIYRFDPRQRDHILAPGLPNRLL